MQNDKVLLLIAQRRAMGLNMTEFADLPNVEQDKRVIADYESRRRKPADSYDMSVFMVASHYNLLLEQLNRDIARFNLSNPRPAAEDRLLLPFFEYLSDFTFATSNTSVTYWRIWQAAVGHLVLAGKITRLNDEAPIPASFINTLFWLKGGYEHDLVIDEIEGGAGSQTLDKDDIFTRLVKDLEMTVRTTNCLLAAGVKTIGELVSLDPIEVIGINQLGKGSLKEIESRLSDLGLSLSMTEGDIKHFRSQ
ncbi:DNA-directed RNA polymerase subunit alpha C-terminal domain-containing protein [Psychrobacter sp. T6-6]|uniref:DNA-directed RNA polymerase subunit alpha C-terminal domain-containing protein n=1 Tax=Psychrobacter sp. T6-6 TaxID=3457452 RepID=UPI003FD46A8C